MWDINKNHILAGFWNVWDGMDFLDAMTNSYIQDHDLVLMFSIDGT